jgi:hypothetical protein
MAEQVGYIAAEHVSHYIFPKPAYSAAGAPHLAAPCERLHAGRLDIISEMEPEASLCDWMCRKPGRIAR